MKNLLSTVVAAAVLSAFSVASHAATFEFNANLNGASQVPANAAAGTGVASLFYDDANTASLLDDSYSFLLLAINLSAPPIAFHIHTGAVGVNGPVVVSLDAAPFSSFSIGGTLSVSGGGVPTPYAGFLADLNATNTYINIHTPSFPGGEIRGQLIPTTPVPEPSTYAMFGLGLGLMGLMARRRAGKSRA